MRTGGGGGLSTEGVGARVGGSSQVICIPNHAVCRIQFVRVSMKYNFGLDAMNNPQ
jgi:hypothetical protein